MLIEKFFAVFLVIQLFHSLEELSTGFHKRFPLLRMSFRSFFAFEILFNAFWLSVFLIDAFPIKIHLMAIFNILMFANGLWHIVWFLFCEKGKKYIPGLITAPIHVITFLIFYVLLLNK